MNYLHWIMLVGIVLSIIKLLSVTIFLFIKIRTLNIIWCKFDKKILSWAIGAFIFEITVAILVNFEIQQVYLINKTIGDLLVELLTCLVSIGWSGFYGYTLFKIGLKIYIFTSE